MSGSDIIHRLRTPFSFQNFSGEWIAGFDIYLRPLRSCILFLRTQTQEHHGKRVEVSGFFIACFIAEYNCSTAASLVKSSAAPASIIAASFWTSEFTERPTTAIWG
jgi:hypothetical protein